MMNLKASQMSLKAWSDDWKMRIDVGTFGVPEPPCPSLWFSLAYIIYPLQSGFSEALDLPETVKVYLLGAFHARQMFPAIWPSLLLFLLGWWACWDCSLSPRNSAWRKARVLLASVHGTALLIFKASTPTALHALITTRTKERRRQCCCFIAFQPGLNPMKLSVPTLILSSSESSK